LHIDWWAGTAGVVIGAIVAFIVPLLWSLWQRCIERTGELTAMLEEFGPLWPRGIAFSAIVVTCLLAFGLYNSRQRAQLSGVLARLPLALLVSACAISALFYAFPSRHLFRGVEALAVILAVCGVLTSRLVFRASNPPKRVRRQLSLELSGPASKSKNSLLLLFALAAALALLALLQKVS
jgi:FlaA1/EpsC-like NDP-sugar epimerase